MLNAADRTQAIYAVIAAQPGFASLNAVERAQVKTQLSLIYGADLSYIIANATVQPGTLQSPAGQPVSTPTGPGATSSPVGIVGAGLVR